MDQNWDQSWLTMPTRCPCPPIPDFLCPKTPYGSLSPYNGFFLQPFETQAEIACGIPVEPDISPLSIDLDLNHCHRCEIRPTMTNYEEDITDITGEYWYSALDDPNPSHRKRRKSLRLKNSKMYGIIKLISEEISRLVPKEKSYMKKYRTKSEQDTSLEKDTVSNDVIEEVNTAGGSKANQGVIKERNKSSVLLPNRRYRNYRLLCRDFDHKNQDPLKSPPPRQTFECGGRASNKWQQYQKYALCQKTVQEMRELQQTERLIKVLADSPLRTLRSKDESENITNKMETEVLANDISILDNSSLCKHEANIPRTVPEGFLLDEENLICPDLEPTLESDLLGEGIVIKEALSRYNEKPTVEHYFTDLAQ